jgi:hypothetical protein
LNSVDLPTFGRPTIAIRGGVPACAGSAGWDGIAAPFASAQRDEAGAITGYHSNRRVPDPAAVAAVQPLYASLLEIERAHPRKADGLAASMQAMAETLQAKRISYDEFVWSLTPAVAA